MSKRRKQKKLFGRMSILYITMIIALSFMGVGYAAWSSGLTINMGITTGNIAQKINIDQSEYSGLEYELLNNNMTLYISGEVYEDFNKDLLIEIQDKGSIPSNLNNIDELSKSDVVKLAEQNKSNHYSLLSLDTDKIETFQLNINTSKNDVDIIEFRSNSLIYDGLSDSQDEISHLQNEIDKTKEEINNIQMEIERLRDLKEKHNFKYNLNFKQGL